MKKKVSSILLTLIFMAGLAIMAYPKVSDYWNSFHASRAIVSYTEAVSGLSEEEYEELYKMAEVYNSGLLERQNPYLLTEEEKSAYPEILNVGGDGIMGYIEIPIINVELPIYHGTSENVLQVGVGHLDWTSLPVGGESTHAVLSGHRGLPSAELFTTLDRLVVGDRFTLNVLNEILTYEVDQILIVLPEDVGALQIAEGEDQCTLVTCTPYGVNTHRILVRGHRVETEHTVRVTTEAIQVEPLLVAAALAIPLLVVMFALMMSGDQRQWDDRQDYRDEI